MRYLLLIAALFGCGLLESASPRVERFECQVRALEPVVGDVLDARQLLQDLYAGKANLGSALNAVRATQAEADALVEALNACEPPVKFPVGEAS